MADTSPKTDPKTGIQQTKQEGVQLAGPRELAATKQYHSVDEIDTDIAKYTSELNDKQSRPLTFNAVCVAVGVVLALLVAWLTYSYLQVQGHHSLMATGGFSVAALLIGIVVPMAFRQSRLASLRAALNILEVRKRSMAPLTGAAQGSTTYFDRLVDINVKNLGDYYGLVRLHNDKSFSVSVWVGVFGFLLIAAAVGFALFKSNDELPAAISAGSGVITEFISAVFFYLYNRSVREMRDYFDSLLTVQNILLSLKLVTDTQDEKEKAQMVGLMLTYLVSPKAARKTTASDDEKPKPAAGEDKPKSAKGRKADKAESAGDGDAAASA
jgi:hypothetical protein